MTELKVIEDPAVLNFLLTEDLYAIKDASPAGARPEVADEPHPATAAAEKPGPEPNRNNAAEPLSAPPGKEFASDRAPEQYVFHYLGENRRFILTLVHYPEEKYLPQAEKEYLEKILSSVKVAPEDIALLNYAHYTGAGYAALKDFFAFNYLLLFGVRPELLRIPGPVLPYHLGLVAGVKILAADPTEVLKPDNAKKKALWEQLKKTF